MLPRSISILKIRLICTPDQGCIDFNEWENDLEKMTEKYLKIKKKKKEIEKLNKVEKFINDCKKEYLKEELISNNQNFDKRKWDWKTKYPYFCPRKGSI